MMSLGQVFAVQHVGVGSCGAWGWTGSFRKAPLPVECGSAHEAGGELVAEVALEDSVFDEDVFLGGRGAFVVDVERAAAVGHGSVIVDGDFGAGVGLADEAGNGGGLFAVDVGFEAVTDGFVKRGLRASRGRGRLPCLQRGRATAFELENGLAGGFVGVVLGGLGALEEVEPRRARLLRRRCLWRFFRRLWR